MGPFKIVFKLGHEHFKDYIFYIKLQIATNRYITIKRPLTSNP